MIFRGSGEHSHSCGCAVGCGDLAPPGLVGSLLPQRVLFCGAPMSRAFALGFDPLGGPASCARLFRTPARLGARWPSVQLRANHGWGAHGASWSIILWCEASHCGAIFHASGEVKVFPARHPGLPVGSPGSNAPPCGVPLILGADEGLHPG